MKRFNIILLIILFANAIIFSSCAGNKEPKNYIVKGKFENANGKTVHLGKLTATDITPVDSFLLTEDGEFEFSQLVNSSPEFYLLRIDKTGYLYLLIDSADNFTISGDAENITKTYSIDGSVDSKIIQEASQHNFISLAKIDSIGKVYQENINHPKIDSVKSALDKVYESIFTKEKAFVQNLIKNNPSSIASYMILYQQLGNQNFVLNPQDDIEYYEMVDKGIFKKYPKSQYAQSLHTTIAQIKEQSAMEKVASNTTAVGSIAPEIELTNPDGKIIKLSDFKGQYVLLDFWASWCRPCRGENPNLVANYAKYHTKGFEIFQVSLDKSNEAWVNAISKDNLNWIHVSDLKYWDAAPAKLYNIRSIPASFLLDKEGKIIATNLRGPALGNKLSELLD